MDFPLPSPDEVIPEADLQAFAIAPQAGQSDSVPTSMSQDPFWSSVDPDVSNLFNKAYHQKANVETEPDLYEEHSQLATGQMNDPFYPSSSGAAFDLPSGPGQERTPVPADWANTLPQAVRTSSSPAFSTMISSSPRNFSSFSQVVLGDPLVQLKPGEYIESRHAPQAGPMGPVSGPSKEPVRFTNSSSDELTEALNSLEGLRLTDEQQIALGNLDLNNLTANQVLFNFGVISIMARLSPRFEFKYGGHDGTQVGLRLTVFGHTVVIAPVAQSAHFSRILGCRKILEKLRKYNPHWLTAPLPAESPTRPEWNWVRLLEDFRGLLHLTLPMYNPSVRGNQWDCELSLDSRFFKTESSVGSLFEAQNTVAHMALYALLVDECVPVDMIAAASGAQTFFPGPDLMEEQPFETRTRASLSSFQPTIIGRAVPLASLPTSEIRGTGAAVGIEPETGSPYRIRRGRGRGRKGKNSSKKASKKVIFKPVARPSKSYNPAQVFNSPTAPKPPKAKTSKPSKAPNPPNPPRINANYIPLINSRIAPLEEQLEDIVDPLATLKLLEKELAALTKDTSYRTILTRICSVLRCTRPVIRLEKNPDHMRFNGQWIIRAWFDMTYPYLGRASPILLQDKVPPQLPAQKAESYGAKKVILYLIRMMGEDTILDKEEGEFVSFASLEVAYAFPTIVDLEQEIEHSLRRTPIESLLTADPTSRSRKAHH